MPKIAKPVDLEAVIRSNPRVDRARASEFVKLMEAKQGDRYRLVQPLDRTQRPHGLQSLRFRNQVG